jgi:hypothetical protein
MQASLVRESIVVPFLMILACIRLLAEMKGLNRPIVDSALDAASQPASRPIPTPPAVSQVRVRRPLHTVGTCFVKQDGYAELKGEQAACIVDETLSFNCVRDTARQSDSPGDSYGGDGVCRSHNRNGHEAEAPVKTVENPWRNEGNCCDSESGQAEG